MSYSHIYNSKIGEFSVPIEANTIGPTATITESQVINLNDDLSTLFSGVDMNTTSINTLNSEMATANSNIATNTANIATNTSNIATNTANIATNSSQIVSLQNVKVPYSGATGDVNLGSHNLSTTGNLSSTNITTDETNISTLQGQMSTANLNIATNTSNIATNTSNIATNTANIATNTSNIALNQIAITALQNGTVPYSGALHDVNLGLHTLTTSGVVYGSNITTDETNISTLQGQMTTANSNISTLQSDKVPYSGATGDINLGTHNLQTTGNLDSSNIGTLQNTGTLGSDIGTQLNGLYTLVTGGGNTFVPYTGAQLDVNLGSHNLTTTGNVSSANITTLTNNVATNTSNIATNTSNIATNTSNIATNTTNISSLQTDKVPYSGCTGTVDLNTCDLSNVGSLSCLLSTNISGVITPQIERGFGTGDIVLGSSIQLNNPVNAGSNNITTTGVVSGSNITTMANNISTLQSGKVPYSGATGDVNLGTHNLTTTGNVTSTNITTDETNISTLQGQMTTANSNIATNTSNITTLQSGKVPYTGATGDVNLGTYNLTTTGNVTSTNITTDEANIASLQSGKVPYTGATGDVNLGTHNLTTTGTINTGTENITNNLYTPKIELSTGTNDITLGASLITFGKPITSSPFSITTSGSVNMNQGIATTAIRTPTVERSLGAADIQLGSTLITLNNPVSTGANNITTTGTVNMTRGSASSSIITPVVESALGNADISLTGTSVGVKNGIRAYFNDVNNFNVSASNVNLTNTAPILKDSNGNAILRLTPNTSSVNNLQINNGATGISPNIGVDPASGDANIALYLYGKGNAGVIINGRTNGVSLPAGTVGEYVIASGFLSMTVSGTSYNLTQQTLSPGLWNVFGSYYINDASNKTISNFAGLSSTSATLPTLIFQAGQNGNGGAGAQYYVDARTVPNQIINVTSNTTMYLVATATFAGGASIIGYGSVYAIRLA